MLGVPGSGKTAVARRMMAAGFHRVRFADPARDMLAAGFGCTDEEIDGATRERSQRRFGGQSVQFLMWSLIEEWGRRGVHSDLFNYEWRRRVDDVGRRNADSQAYVVSDDLRRPCEAAAVRTAGGIIVRVTRPGYLPPSAHAAAKALRIDADIELTNRSPEGLAVQTDAFIKSLGEAAPSEAA